MTQGFYCLIQYCPDASRAETANVGLVLFQVEPPATLVRVLEDVQSAVRRLGRRDDASTIRALVQSMRARIEHEQFRSLEALEKFVRTRGNQLQLTMPRPMAIQKIESDLAEMFAELVDGAQLSTADQKQGRTLLHRVFTGLAQRLPHRVFIAHDFQVKDLGIPVHADYAYRNGFLNLVREVPRSRSLDDALALSKQGELVRRLEEGEGRLYVVSSQSARTPRALEREQLFGKVLGKLGGAEFVPAERVPEFTRRVEDELAGH